MRFGWQQANGAVADMSPVSDKLNRGENQVDKMYTEFMDEISADELYEGLLAYGFFAEKLPPV